MSKLAHLRQLHQQASKPPWTYEPVLGGTSTVMAPDEINGGETSIVNYEGQFEFEQDARLTAAMRNALPHLLDIAEAASEIPQLRHKWRTMPSDAPHNLLAEALNRLEQQR